MVAGSVGQLNLKHGKSWLIRGGALVAGNLATLIQVIRRSILGRNPVFLIGPGAQINQLASFGAKWAVRVRIRPFHRLFAGGAFNVHSNLQK
jgi:hypothetical protein